MHHKKEFSYVFVSRPAIESLMTWMRDGTATLNTLRVFSAITELEQASKNPYKKGPVTIRHVTNYKVRQNVIEAEEPRIYKLPGCTGLEQSSVREKIKVSRAALRFIARKATRGEACVLMTYFLQRVYKKGKGRMKYSLIQTITGLAPETISRSLKSLEKHQFLIRTLRCRSNHWVIQRHGAEYRDGKAMWGSLVGDKVKNEVPNAESFDQDVQSIEVPESYSCASEDRPYWDIEDLMFNIEGLLQKSEVVPQKIEVCNPIIEVPILQEEKNKNLENKNIRGLEDQNSALVTVRWEANPEYITLSDLRDPERRAKLFLKITAERTWRLGLKHKSIFDRACDECVVMACEGQELSMHLKDKLNSIFNSVNDEIKLTLGLEGRLIEKVVYAH